MWIQILGEKAEPVCKNGQNSPFPFWVCVTEKWGAMQALNDIYG